MGPVASYPREEVTTVTGEQEVRARLARLPRPGLPEHVRARIEARLADEAPGVVVPITSVHRRRLNWLLAAATVAGFATLVGVSGSGSPDPVPLAAPPVVRAGAVFEPAGFSDELRARWHEAGTPGPTRTFADSPAGISACARAVQAYGRVMALDVGTYDDVDVVVLVASYVPNTAYEEVWVVRPACGQGQAPVMRHLILDLDSPATAGAAQL
jgi:hypothetical protein